MTERFDFSGIYAIVHRASHRWYIGQAQNISLRWAVHKATLRAGKHHCKYLQRAWNKYGEEAFDWLVVERCYKEELDEFEQWWMDMTPDLFNAQPTAGSARGFKVSDAAKKKMSKAAKRIAADPEERKRRSDRVKAQHAAGKLGWVTISEEGKEKIKTAGREAMRKHGAKGRIKANAALTSIEASRRSYQRKMFKHAPPS